MPNTPSLVKFLTIMPDILTKLVNTSLQADTFTVWQQPVDVTAVQKTALGPIHIQQLQTYLQSVIHCFSGMTNLNLGYCLLGVQWSYSSSALLQLLSQLLNWNGINHDLRRCPDGCSLQTTEWSPCCITPLHLISLTISSFLSDDAVTAAETLWWHRSSLHCRSYAVVSGNATSKARDTLSINQYQKTCTGFLHGVEQCSNPYRISLPEKIGIELHDTPAGNRYKFSGTGFRIVCHGPKNVNLVAAYLGPLKFVM